MNLTRAWERGFVPKKGAVINAAGKEKDNMLYDREVDGGCTSTGSAFYSANAP
jgi:hypothetical protein